MEQILIQLQGQYRLRLALRRGFEGLVWGAAAALFLTLAVKTCGVSRSWDSPAIKAGLVLLAGIIGAFPSGLAIPSRYELAKRIDDHFRWGDQLSSAYAFRGRAEDEPMASLTVEEAGKLVSAAPLGQALPGPRWGLGGVAAALLGASLALPAAFYPPPKPVVMEEETRKELQEQVKNLDELLRLETEDLTEEEKKHFESIRQMIEELQLEDHRLSRKEILARFAREIEGLEEEQGSDALKRALEQLKEAKDAIAGRMLLNRQIEEIEKQQTELAVVDEKTGRKLKAEEIQVMIVQEERRKKQAELAKDIRKAADEEGQQENVASWQVDAGTETSGAAGGQAGEGGPPARTRVIASYEDLVKAAEKTDIRKMIFAAAADGERLSREYQEVYANYHRAFSNLLHQGQLSLGTREYLRRYFRAIRPQKPDKESQK